MNTKESNNVTYENKIRISYADSVRSRYVYLLYVCSSVFACVCVCVVGMWFCCNETFRVLGSRSPFPAHIRVVLAQQLHHFHFHIVCIERIFGGARYEI